MNPIELAQDPCGRPVVRVKLAKGAAEAVLDLNDYERVTQAVGPAVWFLNSSGNRYRYVRVWDHASARNVTIARLILGGVGGPVRHADGDPLNLRRTNLIRPRRRT